MFVMRNNIKLHVLKDIKIQGWHIGESPNVYIDFRLVLLRSDHPTFIYQDVKIMRNNHDGKLHITRNDVDYWKRIHQLNYKQPAKSIEKPAQVSEYIIQTFELLNIDQK